MHQTHGPSSRYLPLFTFDGRRRLAGKVHLAQVKSTKKAVAVAWCGRRYFVDPAAKPLTGEAALLLWATDDDGRGGWQPTCTRCLDRIGAWAW